MPDSIPRATRRCHTGPVAVASARGCADVGEVVHGVVNGVARQRLEGEWRSGAARTRPRREGAGYGVVGVGVSLRGIEELSRYPSRILLRVTVVLCGLVLVPVREFRVVLGEHQLQPSEAHAVDVAHV